MPLVVHGWMATNANKVAPHIFTPSLSLSFFMYPMMKKDREKVFITAIATGHITFFSGPKIIYITSNSTHDSVFPFFLLIFWDTETDLISISKGSRTRGTWIGYAGRHCYYVKRERVYSFSSRKSDERGSRKGKQIFAFLSQTKSSGICQWRLISATACTISAIT